MRTHFIQKPIVPIIACTALLIALIFMLSDTERVRAANCAAPGSNATFVDLGDGRCRAFITYGSPLTFVAPTDWTAVNTIEVVGGGGGGNSTGNGGGGGGYSKSTNVSLSNISPGETVTIKIGAGGLGGSGTGGGTGGDTYICKSTVNCTSYNDADILTSARGGFGGNGSTGGAGGSTSGTTGNNRYSGAAGATFNSKEGGGGGTGGVSSNGLAGSGTTGAGGNGGTGSGGIGGTWLAGTGNPGGVGTAWGTSGPGGGGGGSSGIGGAGALYGGGGGGGNTGNGGQGGDGIIVITYTPPPPTITVAASGAPNENPLTTGTYTLTRTNSGNNLSVSYVMSGGATYGASFDYTLGAGTCTPVSSTAATMPSGLTTCTIILTPNNDTTLELGETAVLTLSSGTGYSVGSPSNASLTILSDDYTVSGTQSSAAINLWDADYAAVGTIGGQGANGTDGFTITPNRVRSGTKATFSWTVANMLTCSIDNGIGAVDATTGTHTTPTPDITAQVTYVLTCSDGTNPALTRTATVGIIPNYIEL